MKTTSPRFVFLIAFATIAFATRGLGQSTLLVTRTVEFVQNGATSGDVVAASATPYHFTAAVEGTNSITPTVYLPDGTTHYDLSASGNNMIYTSANYSTLGALTADYPDSALPPGTPSYTISNLGAHPNVAIGLSDASASAVNTPFLTLTGGTWIGSVYYFNPADTVTVSFNAISGASSDNFHYEAEVNGPDLDGNDVNDFVSATDTPPPFTLQSFGTLVAGNSYSIQVNFDDIQFLNPDAFGDSSNVLAAGLFERRLTVNLTAIPEPLTSAATLGSVALTGVILRRWRRKASVG
ncbi:MAG TPA: hypothetical protein VG710_03770 [Opitutus sp.]|nr:hypothetical protein [Opitutus sp.]